MKNIVFYAAIGVLLITAGYLFIKQRQTANQLQAQKQVFDKQAFDLIRANTIKIDSLQSKCFKLDSMATFYKLQAKKSASEKVAISQNFKPLYNEINNTNDSLQYNITLQLLAKHRETRLERN